MVQGCNLNCTHCFTLGNKDPYRLLDYSTATSFLKTIKEKINPYKATVYIHGGETFLAPRDHLAKINQIVRAQLPETKLNIIPQTNLMYTVDMEYVEFIRKEYGNQLGVSWDYGIRFDTTAGRLNEELFFKNFRFLIDQGVQIAVAITVQKFLLNCDIEATLPLFDGAISLDFEFLTMFDEKSTSLKVNNREWGQFYERIVDFYAHNKTTWSLPQVDLFTKTLLENKIYDCKCNCCQHRTFTLNCNGTLGLCPDETYVRPISDIQEFSNDWDSFELKARTKYLEHITHEVQPICQSCEFFDLCGGNCEPSLFDGGTDCPLSKNVIKFQKENLNLFKNKLQQAKSNLVELKS